MGVGCQCHAPCRFIPGKEIWYTFYRRLGGPVLTGAESLAATGIRSAVRPVRSVSLYRLSYTGTLLLAEVDVRVLLQV